MDLVLHIGSGKTGTTSIQQFLKQNRSRLAQLGTLVPREPGMGRHVKVGLYIKPDEDLRRRLTWHGMEYSSPAEFREDFRTRLSAEIDESGLSRVLLTDEGVYASNEEAVARLRDLVADVAQSWRLVVYLRRQDEHVCSNYQQKVKAGCVERLSDWVLRDMTVLYDYATRLSLFDRMLAPSELVVRRFERESFVEGSLFQDFLDAVGIDVPSDDLDQVPRRNPSLDAESVEFLRLLNLHRVEDEGATADQVDNRGFLRILMKASSGPTLTLPEPLRDAFMAQWEESNRAVAKNFLGDGSGQLFRAPRKAQGTTPEQRLDPERLPHFFELLELPEEIHAPLRRIAEREARVPDPV
ncbi:MAG: hypothetical protein J2P22_05245 [Nocardioides sp.]|nr:hypothetical protein [Nocardioides sp.]